MLQVACPSCKTVLAVKPEFLGKAIRCPRCQTVLQLKAPEPPAAPPPAPMVPKPLPFEPPPAPSQPAPAPPPAPPVDNLFLEDTISSVHLPPPVPPPLTLQPAPLPPPLPPLELDLPPPLVGVPPPLPEEIPDRAPARRRPARREADAQEFDDPQPRRPRRSRHDDEDEDQPRRRRGGDRPPDGEARRKVALPALMMTLSGAVAAVSILVSVLQVMVRMSEGGADAYFVGASCFAVIQLALCILFFVAGGKLRACRAKGLVITMAVIALILALLRGFGLFGLVASYRHVSGGSGEFFCFTSLLILLVGLIVNSLAGILTFVALGNPAVKDAYDER